MGNLRDGAWTDEDTLSEDQGGKYVKVPSRFRNWITADGASGFKAEPGVISCIRRLAVHGPIARYCSGP